MKRVTWVWLVCSFISSSSFAAVPDSGSISDGYSSPVPPVIQLRAAPAVMMVFGQKSTSATALGAAASLTFFSSGRTDVGIDTGAYFYSDRGQSASLIPVMFTLLHRFSDSYIRPYIGFSAGTSILTGTGTETEYNPRTRRYEDTDVSQTLPLPSLGLRTGVEFQLSQGIGLFAEARGGVILIVPYLNPNLGLSVSL